MSPRRPILSRAPVIAGVLVLLAAVVVLNVRTFAPRHGRPGPGRVADAGAGPGPSQLLMDAEDVARQAARPAGDPAQPSVGPRPAITRDPFSGGRRAAEASVVGGPFGVGAAAGAVSAGATAAAAPAARTNAPAAAPTSRDGKPVCTAVMLGARAPAAVIDGRLCRVGDTVRGLRVERIEAGGVTLAGEGTLFLPVGVVPAGGAHGVVNGELSADRLGRTSLAPEAESERK